jgi:hypothetical protein
MKAIVFGNFQRRSGAIVHSNQMRMLPFSAGPLKKKISEQPELKY